MEDDQRPVTSDNEALLHKQIQQLQERLAFYEGFDTLIQDNVTHARELFRLAANERAAASTETTRSGNGHHEGHLRAELEAVSRELVALASTVEALSRRVATALGEAGAVADAASTADPEATWPPQRAAIVVHGVASARSALSLQRFVHALPQVSGVKTREFAGGVLRLDADLSQPLKAAHFDAWDRVRHVQVLTDRPDVFEVAVEEAEAPVRLSW